MNLVELEVFLSDIEPELPNCPVPVIENRIRDAIIDACERSNIWRWQHPEILIIEGVQHYDLATPTADTLIHSVIDVYRNGRPINDCEPVNRHESYGGHGSGFSVSERGSLCLSSKPKKSTPPVPDSIDPDTVDRTLPVILDVPVDPGGLDDGAIQEQIDTYQTELAAYNASVAENKARIAEIAAIDKFILDYPTILEKRTRGLEPILSIKPSRKTLHIDEVLVRDYYDLIVNGALYRALMMRDRPWSDPTMGKEYQMKYEMALAKARQGIDRGFKTGSQRFKPRKFV